jgi:ABC-type multidrug transport system fused ATPase/permease subunit
MKHFFTQMWPFIRQSLTWVLVGSIGGLFMNILASAIPIALGKAIDLAFALEKAPTNTALRSRLIVSLLVFAGVSALYSGLRVAKRLGFRYTDNRMRRDMRETVLSTAMRWPMARFHGTRVGDLMSRMVGDTEVMSRTVRGSLTEAFDTGIMMIVAFIVLMFYNLRLTLLVLIPVPLVVLLAEAAGRAVQSRSLAARTATGNVVAHLQEAISGIRVLRLLGCETQQARQLETLTRTEVDANLSVMRLQGGILPACSALAHIGTAAVIWLGGTAVFRGEMSVGDLVAYLVLFEKAVRRSLVIARELNAIHAGRAALTRTELLLGDLSDTSEVAPPPRHQEGEVHIRDLTFAYPGQSEPILKGLNLTLRPGQLIAVTGPVACGKTALARALLGIYPWLGGEIENEGAGGTVSRGAEGGSGVSPLLRFSLSPLVAYCPQEASLFSGTIAENIAFNGATDAAVSEEVRHAAFIAALETDVAGFPDGFGTLVGEGGVRVSGGQRQRIALARAIYSGRPWLVLDEPFASVDVSSEARIIERMRTHLKDRVILLLSHRLSAFPKADHILVLNSGKVVEQGTHTELMRIGKVYAAIYRAQCQVTGGESCQTNVDSRFQS